MLLEIIGGVIGIPILALAGLWIWAAIDGPRYQRELADGTHARRYVWVEDDGTARELDADEIVYLSTEFHPNDGGRPYIKWRYKALTPDGKIGGYMLRRKLPKGMPVRPAVS